jgi:hypothetical protein
VIYCVPFSEVVEYLNSIGFRQVGMAERQLISADRTISLRSFASRTCTAICWKNVVNDAFYTARLEPSEWMYSGAID